MRHLLYFLSFLLIMNTANAQYKIINTHSGNEISLEKMVHDLQQADIVLFGEEHNDSIGHLLELEILQRLYMLQSGDVVASYEMWQTDVQETMNEYLNGWISEKNFIKESRAWGNYEDYKPMIDFAKAHSIPVICANTPSRYVNMVTRGKLQALEQLPYETLKKYLPPLPIKVLDGRYQEKFQEIMGGHDMPNMHLYESQNLWDATMANSILNARLEYPNALVIHYNGRFHSDEYQGVTRRIVENNYGIDKVKTISCFQGKTYNKATMQELADFVILTE